MRVRGLTGTPLPDGPDWRPPLALIGLVVLGVVEILTDDGRHQAYALALREPERPAWVRRADPPRRFALWWRREPSRRWELTPF